MKTQYVNAIRSGQRVDDLFVLSRKNLAQKRDGSNYLTLALTDKTGSIKGVVWDNVDRIAAAVNSGDFVRASGTISEYRGDLQFVVRELALCPAGDVDPNDFMPATRHDIDRMFDQLVNLTASMQNQHLRALMEAFWNDADIARAFRTAPAAKKMHHAFVGGLLEHTLSMAVLADKVAGHYRDVDRDLLITGVMLHDIGKIEEFDYQTRIDYSDEGRLISHIVIAVRMVEEKIAQLKDFPRELAMLVKHMIVSHHGERQFGSPEPPKTLEAVLLHTIDEMDSKVNAIREFMAADTADGHWTGYHRLLERHFYKGKKE
jgi:3'-5' exoribonuclease